MKLNKVIRLAHRYKLSFGIKGVQEPYFRESKETGTFMICWGKNVQQQDGKTSFWNPTYYDFVSNKWELKKDSTSYDELSGKPKNSFNL